MKLEGTTPSRVDERPDSRGAQPGIVTSSITRFLTCRQQPAPCGSSRMTATCFMAGGCGSDPERHIFSGGPHLAVSIQPDSGLLGGVRYVADTVSPVGEYVVADKTISRKHLKIQVGTVAEGEGVRTHAHHRYVPRGPTTDPLSLAKPSQPIPDHPPRP